MDLGQFQRSKRLAMMWLAAPPLMIAFLHAGANLCTDRVARQAARSEELMRVLPVMTEALAQARRLDANFQRVNGTATMTPETLIAAVTELAQAHELTLQSLVVEAAATGGKPPPVKISASLQGEWHQLACFFNQLQPAEALMSLESARLSLLRNGHDEAEAVHAMEFVLLCQPLPSPSTGSAR